VAIQACIVAALLFIALTNAVALTQRSCAPIIYVIDYSDKWITDPAAADEFEGMPPDLLHIGKAVPITHIWGPIPLMAGENQYTGGPKHTLNRDAIRLLSPDELERKISLITAAVKRLHDVGVNLVMPYICHFTIAGDHEKNEGFFAFYQRWDDYARWLGPKPEEPPTLWIMRDAQGRRIESPYGYTPSYFAPLHRYAVCPNNPSWNKFSAAIVRLIAMCGYDGVFVDNAIAGGDECEHCERAFQRWVRENFNAAVLAKICGTDGVGEISVRNRNLRPLINRWHVAVVRDRLAMLREEGKRVKAGFKTFANVGDFQRAIPYGDGCDLFMFESIQPPGCTIIGEPPPSPNALLLVADGAEERIATVPYEAIHRDLFVELAMDLQYPQVARLGKPVKFVMRVKRVGDSNTDADCMESPMLELIHIETGESESIPLGPLPGVGDPRIVAGAVRPPVELHGEWLPRRVGYYGIRIRYRYTDADHIDVANRVQIADELTLGNIYRSNLPGLSCTFNSRARMVGLWYLPRDKAWEPVAELALAECAASGGRFIVNARPGTTSYGKYWSFFRRHGSLLSGLIPYGSIALLYAYWGGNPGAIGRAAGRTVAEHLSASHVLYYGLVDRDLEPSDLIGLKALILVCRNYELNQNQITALRSFVLNGGRLILEHQETTVNFVPIERAIGIPRERLEIWDWEKPPSIAEPMCESGGRMSGVRITAFAEPSQKPKLLLVHVLNYNITCVESAPGKVSEIDGIQLRIPVPSTWHTAAVTCCDPDRAQPLELNCEIKGSTAIVALPRLRVYQMLILRAVQER